MNRSIIVALVLVGLVSFTPAASADPPPGFGRCEINEDEPVWLEEHDGTYWVAVDGTWRPLECHW